MIIMDTKNIKSDQDNESVGERNVVSRENGNMKYLCSICSDNAKKPVIVSLRKNHYFNHHIDSWDNIKKNDIPKETDWDHNVMSANQYMTPYCYCFKYILEDKEICPYCKEYMMTTAYPFKEDGFETYTCWNNDCPNYKFDEKKDRLGRRMYYTIRRLSISKFVGEKFGWRVANPKYLEKYPRETFKVEKQNSYCEKHKSNRSYGCEGCDMEKSSRETMRKVNKIFAGGLK